MEPPYNSERGARSLEGRGRQARSQQQQVNYDNYDDDILDGYGGGGDDHHQIEERQATYNSGKGGGEALMPYRCEKVFSWGGSRILSFSKNVPELCHPIPHHPSLDFVNGDYDTYFSFSSIPPKARLLPVLVFSV